MKRFGSWGVRVFALFFAIGWSLAASNYEKNSVTAFSNKVYKSYVVVVSVDALNAKDFDTIKELPNFKKLIENGSYAREVVGVYPSLTYPSHTSIITGTYPDKHGIVNNKRNEIGVKSPTWYWYSKDIKVPTVYELAKKKNLTVGALAWPVTAGADIDYNYPEIWTTKLEQDETELIAQNGTPDFVRYIRSRFGKKLKERQQPELDNFITDSAVYLIKSKKTDLTLIHLGELDSKRHGYGADASIVKEILKKQDERLGRIINASKEAATYDSTTFIILGDHGFIDIDKKVNLNVAFKNEGLITTDKEDSITNWEAVVDACDGSAYIYLRDKNDTNLKNRVEAVLAQYKNQNEYGIEDIYSKTDIEKFRTNPEADYMLEAKKGFFFSNEWQGQAIVEKSKALGTHGFSPYKPDYNTFLLISGARAKKGVVLPKANLVDEGPTMARLLNLKMDNVDGRVLTELVK
jgi:predicted AlkP superfamily pyrophosphatase or phosphodiesterase